MRTLDRTIAGLVPALLLVAAACGGPAASPTPAPTTASPAAVGTPNAAVAATLSPVATPPASVEPMAPARVTGTVTLNSAGSGTRTGSDDAFTVTGVVVKGSAQSTDPRVTGEVTARITISGTGAMGWEVATMTLANAGGAWNGTCSGVSWADGNASDLSCWYTGTGAYKGLTYYEHSRAMSLSVAVEGVILPIPAPSSAP